MGNYFILEIKKEGSDMIDKLVVIQGMDTLDGLYNYMEQIRKNARENNIGAKKFSIKKIEAYFNDQTLAIDGENNKVFMTGNNSAYERSGIIG